MEAEKTYLSFKLKNENFLISTENVKEIVQVGNFTEIPLSDKYLRGVFNLRGAILPLIDTRYKFGLGNTNIGIDTKILIIDVDSEGVVTTLGALVDNVSEVFELSNNEILESKIIASDYPKRYIKGMVKVKNNFTMLINPLEVF